MRRRARAFTLIELLVVIVLLGILVSVAVLGVGGSSTARELRDEARRLAALIGVLSDEAVLDSREYGLLVDSQGYRVLRYDEAAARWRESERREARELPEWMRLELALDGTPLVLLAPPK
ncbi:type II secretion system minor pseudopilin GspH, partial [Pseudomonas sp. BAY1663]|uniref:type II secretion system minor pseudopilin GspH n=1 Tax=Pseudomonas sp. BAY1663 TaxID=1439940 RepID=UPI0005630C98